MPRYRKLQWSELITRDSEGLDFNKTDWISRNGVTFKTGANFNMTETSNVFLNLGYLNRTPQYSNVVDNNTNTFFDNLVNEKILASRNGLWISIKTL